MSILTSSLPDYLTISGEKCPIYTDFKVWLKFSEIVEEGTPDEKKIAEIFMMIFPKLPKNLFQAFPAILDFYRCSKQSEETNAKSSSKQMFSFEHDSDMIYSAFYQQYNIDLAAAKMHWWQFKALFNGLSDTTQFIKVVGFRGVNLSEIKNNEMRKYYSKMKRIYKLPDNRSESEKEDALNAMFSASFC